MTKVRLNDVLWSEPREVWTPTQTIGSNEGGDERLPALDAARLPTAAAQEHTLQDGRVEVAVDGEVRHPRQRTLGCLPFNLCVASHACTALGEGGRL